MRRVAARLALLVMVVACSPERSAAPAPSMSIGNPINTGSKEPYTLAVIGDTPYGPEKLAEFPALTDLINGDPKVSLVTHLGDIKAGSRRSRRMPQTIVIQIGNLAAAFDKPVLLPSISG